MRMLTDMCADVRMQTCIEMHRAMCINMCIGMRRDMHVVNRNFICLQCSAVPRTPTCISMTCTGHVYGHVYTYACRHGHEHFYGDGFSMACALTRAHTCAVRTHVCTHVCARVRSYVYARSYMCAHMHMCAHLHRPMRTSVRT